MRAHPANVSIASFVVATALAPGGPAAAAPEPPAVSLATFAQGAIPLTFTVDGAAVDLRLANAVLAIDGSPTPFTLVRQGTASSVAELVLELPALTTFERFAVPEVREVPSAGTTFVRAVEVLGSGTSATEGFTTLAAGVLVAHGARGQETELAIQQRTPVRWLKLRLGGGLDLRDGKASLQFSELVATGRQETPALATGFKGIWAGPGVLIELAQDGATVTGCYDSDGGELAGSVTGNILHAVGVDPGDKVRSLFVLAVAPDGSLRGLRSTNGAPFKPHNAPRAAAGKRTKCSPRPPKIGCGSIIHAIRFDVDSDKLRPESDGVLGQLHAGLTGTSGAVVIVGHTSSEGSDAHNQDLSERRARSVVADLVRRGLPSARIRATGRGEAAPIASNDDETGRSMNRRVEVQCD